MPKTTHESIVFTNPTAETKARVREAVKKLKRNWQKDEVIEWAKGEYGVSERTALRYYQEAQRMLQENVPDPEFVKQVRSEQIARITALARKADEKGDTKSALKALDMINKITGLYTEKQEVNITSDTIRFEFDTRDEEQ